MNLNRLSQFSIIFLAAVIFFVILYQFQGFLRPFFIALILSFLFVPITRMSKRKKRTIWLITGGVIITLFLVVAAISAIFVEETTEDLPSDNNSQTFQEYFESTKFTFMNEKYKLSNIIDFSRITELTRGTIPALVTAVSSFFTEFFLVLIFMFFLIPSHDATVQKIAQDLNPSSKKKFLSALDQIEKSIRSYLSIKTITSLATAILSGIVMYIFGVKFVMLFMILIFLLNFIPSFGSIVAVTLVLITHFLTTDFSSLFFVLAFLLITIQVIIGNIIEPQYAGKGLELSPIIILLSLFFWGTVWGIAGMFFAVPLTSIIKIILQNIDETKGFVTYLK